jgi:hypothetical protein
MEIMDRLFPFGFPASTTLYLILFVVTFALHQAFMHYVLAGSLYIAWATLWPNPNPTPRTELPLAATLRDWNPFLLSAAITAGVAPLLFIQIVYQHEFYTANLLLWWRWMIVVPVLIVAFYLLYLLKSHMLWTWPYPVRAFVALAASASFVFVGFCWTANHLLSSSHREWPDVYVTGRLPFSATVVLLRMLIWIGGSFATMSVIAGWQRIFRQYADEHQVVQTETRSLALMSISGNLVALLAGAIYLWPSDAASRSLLFGNLTLPYLAATIAGLVAQGFSWAMQWQSHRLKARLLWISTVGAIVSLLGVSVLREGIRLRAIDVSSLTQRHNNAAEVGGITVFLIAAVIVSLLIGWCIRMVQTGTDTVGHKTDVSHEK